MGSPPPRLFIACALSCEADPIISYDHLQFCGNGFPYRIYQNESISLIVTGVGKIQTAAAIGFLKGISTNHRSNA